MSDCFAPSSSTLAWNQFSDWFFSFFRAILELYGTSEKQSEAQEKAVLGAVGPRGCVREGGVRSARLLAGRLARNQGHAGGHCFSRAGASAGAHTGPAPPGAPAGTAGGSMGLPAGAPQ